MNTEKTHERFWDAMRARFGLRWITEQGDKPSAPWVQLLNGYRPNELKVALELMSAEKLQHPPTLPVFESLLKKASARENSAAASVDFVRSYWRSAIVGYSAQLLIERQVIPNTAAFERYLTDHRSTLGGSLKLLLDELCQMESRNGGQRTRGIEDHADERCRAIVSTFLQATV